MRFSTAIVPVLAFLSWACGTPGSAAGPIASDEHSEAPVARTLGVCIPTAGLRPRAVDNCSASSYAGQARAISASIETGLLGTVTTSVADTAPLAPSGGTKAAGVETVDVGGIVRAGSVGSAAAGIGAEAASDASVASLVIALAGLGIRADVVESRALGFCGGTVASSTVANLQINGEAVTATGAANQTISVPGIGAIVLNEQVADAAGIHVHALHVKALGLADIVVASSFAGMTCTCAPAEAVAPGTPADPGEPMAPEPGLAPVAPAPAELPLVSGASAPGGKLGAACEASGAPCAAGYTCATGAATVE